MRPGILTLTTDFGADGPYVASIKGVVLGLSPGVQFVDVSHAITPQNILEGAFVLASVVESFPSGTIHLAVVDPGVGTARRLIAAKLADQWFVAPDNGLLSVVAQRYSAGEIWEISNPELRRRTVSATFHGRDILAPAAAHLLLGNDPSSFGSPRHGLVTLPAIAPRREPEGIVGEVIFRDNFGNLITNVPGDWLAEELPDRWAIQIDGHRIEGLSRTYGDHPPGTLVSLVGSQGWAEVSLVNGDAAQHLNCGPGSTVWFRLRQ
ncbi:SAM-dependent chlorinase/fluorinase [soil metagenome]